MELIWSSIGTVLLLLVTLALHYWNRREIHQLKGGDLQREIEDALTRAVLTAPKDVFFEKALERMACLITDMDSGEILWTTPANASLFGYLRGELVGHEVEILVPPEIRDHHRVHRRNFRDSPENFRACYVVEGIRKNGTRFECAITLDKLVISRRFVVMAMVVDLSRKRRNTSGETWKGPPVTPKPDDEVKY